MALSFAIAAEGQTDQRVIDNVLVGFFRDEPEEIAVRWDHPERNESAGWTRLFHYLAERRYREALQYSDYVVVQIDTDCAHLEGFDIPKDIDGRKDPARMLSAVRRRLEELIDPDDLKDYADQLLFAICVNAIECWLLPLHAPDRATDVYGCLKKVNHGLKSKNLRVLNKANVRTYADASSEYRRKKVLLKLAPLQPSLATFLAELERVPRA